jgi:MerR family mercuric resistance operon transcriptional regulator
MRRSELARSAGCHSETLRFYEARGLLPAPPRNAAGHRVYGPDHARRLRFIVRARELGFGLDQIMQLLRLQERPGEVCAEVKTITLAHLNVIEHKIADLGRLEQVLRRMANRCDDGATPNCPIIDALAENRPRVIQPIPPASAVMTMRPPARARRARRNGRAPGRKDKR